MDLKSRPDLHAIDAALKEASGLLPFLTWISATDHHEDSNLVLERRSDTDYRIWAVDFEDAFSAPSATRELAEDDKIDVCRSPGLRNNVDLCRVAACVARIEGLSDDNVRACCEGVGMSEQIGDALLIRRNLLRHELEAANLIKLGK